MVIQIPSDLISSLKVQLLWLSIKYIFIIFFNHDTKMAKNFTDFSKLHYNDDKKKIVFWVKIIIPW